MIVAVQGLFSCGDRNSGSKAPDTGEDDVAVPTPSGDVGELKIAGGGRSWAELDDPSADGWETEVLAEQAQEQLEKLAPLLLGAEDATKAVLADLLAKEFSGTPLTPVEPVVAFQSEGVRVERANGANSPFDDADAFGDSVRALAREFENARNARAKFKIVQVDPAGDANEPPTSFTTRQLVSLSGQTEQGVLEVHAMWIVRWILPGDASDTVGPKLIRLEVRDFERSQSKGRGARPWFSDCTEAVLGGNECYAEQLLRGMNHWLERIPYRAALNRMGMPGIAVGDVNGDYLDDLFLCQEPGLPNRLFLQQADGTLRDVSREWGVDWLQDSRSSILADFDNDGRQDLAVAIFGGLVIAKNTGDRFEIQSVLPTRESTTSLTAADYDRDGRLDLYVCAYSTDRTLEADPQALGPLGARFVFHDAENGSPNILYRNEIEPGGSWTFRDTTSAAGLDQHNTRWSFAASWDDVDNDGDLDLYVANDYGRNCLYRNDRSQDGSVRFFDIAGDAAAEDSASGMSAAWGDYDRDGWMDLYVGNMFSAAGSRVTRQARFMTGIPEDLRSKFQHFARGNTLLRNLGVADKPAFEDSSSRAAVTVGRWAWSSTFADLNNDGWDDLIVANGYITGDEEGGDL